MFGMKSPESMAADMRVCIGILIEAERESQERPGFTEVLVDNPKPKTLQELKAELRDVSQELNLHVRALLSDVSDAIDNDINGISIRLNITDGYVDVYRRRQDLLYLIENYVEDPEPKPVDIQDAVAARNGNYQFSSYRLCDLSPNRIKVVKEMFDAIVNSCNDSFSANMVRKFIDSINDCPVEMGKRVDVILHQLLSMSHGKLYGVRMDLLGPDLSGLEQQAIVETVMGGQAATLNGIPNMTHRYLDSVTRNFVSGDSKLTGAELINQHCVKTFSDLLHSNF